VRFGGVNEAVKLENIHMHFCKSILGVRSQTNNNFVYGELGRYPLRLRRGERVKLLNVQVENI